MTKNFPSPRPSYDLTTGAGRLMHLADVLDIAVPVDRFSIDVWHMPAGHEQNTSTPHSRRVANDVSTEALEGRSDECGFAGCAVGWACSVSEFKECGLALEEVGPRLFPMFGGATDWRAVEAFFGLTAEAAEQLFLPDFWLDPGVSVDEAAYTDLRFHPTPADVAARIRAVVRWNIKQGYTPLMPMDPEALPLWTGVEE